MFSRGRPCLKKCGLPAASVDPVAVGSDEPLLFLYPHWFASMFRQRRSSSSIPSINARMTRNLGLLPRAGRPPRRCFGATSRKWMSDTSALPKTGAVKELDLSAGEDASTATGDGSPRFEGEKENIRTGEDSEGANGSETSPQPGAAGDGSSASLMGNGGVFNAFAGLENKPSTTSPSSIKQRRPLSESQQKQRALLKNLPVRERRKMWSRIFYVRRLREQSTREPILEGSLQDMIEAAENRIGAREYRRSVSRRESHRRLVLVPDETIAVLAGVSEMSMEENIWYVPVHNGCRVHVLPAAESIGHRRKVILSGSEGATQLVEKRIRQTQELQERGDPLIDVRKPLVPIIPSLRALARRNLPVPLVRAVWDSPIRRRPVLLDLILDRSEHLSTVRQFVDHVEELTTSAEPSKTAGLKQPHPKQVAIALQQLFRNDKKQHLNSTAALNIALSFLLEHGLLSDAQELFLRSEHVATVGTYNILLKSAAKKQNLSLFHHVLRIMYRMRVRPNAYTWLAYLECLVSPTRKSEVIKLMDNKGYLQDPPVMRSLLQLMIHDIFTEHLKNGGSVDEFFNKTAETAGLNWFPPSLINQMFNAISRLRNVPAMEQLLDVCRENGFPLTSPAIRDIARILHWDTFSVLRHILPHVNTSSPVLSKMTYERLFFNAFKGQHYNICRVLWRYACMHGAVTFNMRKAVSHSLTQNIRPEGRDELRSIWETSVGKVVVGVDLHLPNYPLKDSLLKHIPVEFHDHPVSSLVTKSRLHGEQRAKQLEAAAAIIQHDMEVGSWYRPRYPLAHMLEAASVLDKEWQGIPRPTKWLMQHAMQVPVKLSVIV